MRLAWARRGSGCRAIGAPDSLSRAGQRPSPPIPSPHRASTLFIRTPASLWLVATKAFAPPSLCLDSSRPPPLVFSSPSLLLWKSGKALFGARFHVPFKSLNRQTSLSLSLPFVPSSSSLCTQLFVLSLSPMWPFLVVLLCSRHPPSRSLTTPNPFLPPCSAPFALQEPTSLRKPTMQSLR